MEASLVLHENELVIYRSKKETVITAIFIIAVVFVLGLLFFYLGQGAGHFVFQGLGFIFLAVSGLGVLVLFRIVDYLKHHPGLPLMKFGSDKLSLNLVISLGVSAYDWSQIDRLVVADSVLYSELDGHSTTKKCVVVFFNSKKVSSWLFSGWRHHRSSTNNGHLFTLVTFPPRLTPEEMKAKIIRFVPGSIPVEVEAKIVLD
ncbi:MAG: hypothetical protein RJB66_536 [Pseudomonadota bacterium]|jgi:hypothetical protein